MPYIGPIASAVPAILIALTVSPVKALWVVGIFLVVQFLKSYLITPLVQERAVSIPPALVVAVQMLYIEDALGDHVEVLGEDVPSE